MTTKLERLKEKQKQMKEQHKQLERQIKAEKKKERDKIAKSLGLKLMRLYHIHTQSEANELFKQLEQHKNN